MRTKLGDQQYAGFLALLGSDASNPGDRKNYDGIQPYMVGGLPRALRALGALAGAGKALIGRNHITPSTPKIGAHMIILWQRSADGCPRWPP